MSAGAVALVAVMPNLPDGLLPFAVLLCGFMLANYSVVLCGALHTASEGVMTMVIIVTNMSITLFIFMIGALPSLHDHLRAPAPGVELDFLDVLAVEARDARRHLVTALLRGGPPSRLHLKGYRT